MTSIDFLVPGSLDQRTGGYRYDKRIIEELRARGHEVCVHRLADTYPFPDQQALDDADQLLGSLDEGRQVVIDGLACGVMADVLARHAHRLELIALVHHPLALETGLTAAKAAELREQECAALTHVGRVITTSPSTTAALADYRVEPARIATVEPGTDTAPLATGSSTPTPNLLCVATVTERKGHQVLVDALRALQLRRPELLWHGHFVGSTERDPDTMARLQHRIAEAGIASRLSFHGEADDNTLERHYCEADLFVLPSFHEGFGMVLTEALAHGLPIVSTTAGAIPDTVPEGTGVLVPAGDVEALSQALEQVLADPDTLASLATTARKARAGLTPWSTSASRFADALSV